MNSLRMYVLTTHYGYTYYDRTMNSLRMSFWMVPLSCAWLTPCSSAATTYMASTGSTAPFIVIETETLVVGK